MNIPKLNPTPTERDAAILAFLATTTGDAVAAEKVLAAMNDQVKSQNYRAVRNDAIDQQFATTSPVGQKVSVAGITVLPGGQPTLNGVKVDTNGSASITGTASQGKVVVTYSVAVTMPADAVAGLLA